MTLKYEYFTKHLKNYKFSNSISFISEYMICISPVYHGYIRDVQVYSSTRSETSRIKGYSSKDTGADVKL